MSFFLVEIFLWKSTYMPHFSYRTQWNNKKLKNFLKNEYYSANMHLNIKIMVPLESALNSLQSRAKNKIMYNLKIYDSFTFFRIF